MPDKKTEISTTQEPLLQVENAPSPDILKTIYNGLVEYNYSILGDRAQQYAVTIRLNANQLLGGIIISAYSELMYIDILWVDNNHQQQGLGSKLLQEAEKEAIKRGCKYACLDTYAFQSEDFYKNRGYQRIGIIPNFLYGYDRICLRKEL